ncbi:MAG: DUF2605 family protein [Cyanobacteriota bacterium]|jgi:hypothetical protein
MVSPLPQPDPAAGPPGALLNQLLEPLMQDFSDSFERGLFLLDHCPDPVLDGQQRGAFRERLERARAELRAARALRAATPAPMALDMATITPWHELLVEVWSLSAALRAAGCHPDQEPEGRSAP